MESTRDKRAPCKCGCGEMPTGVRAYVVGHLPKRKKTFCKCKCGTETFPAKGKQYAPRYTTGHDPKRRGSFLVGMGWDEALKYQPQVIAMAKTICGKWGRPHYVDDVIQELYIELATKIDPSRARGNVLNYVSGALWSAAYKALNRLTRQSKREVMDLDTYLILEGKGKIGYTEDGLSQLPPNTSYYVDKRDSQGQNDVSPGAARVLSGEW